MEVNFNPLVLCYFWELLAQETFPHMAFPARGATQSAKSYIFSNCFPVRAAAQRATKSDWSTARNTNHIFENGFHARAAAPLVKSLGGPGHETVR